MPLSLDDLPIIPSVYDHIYEENNETVGIESTLINVGVMLGYPLIYLDPLKEHFESAWTNGLEYPPTLVMLIDSQHLNQLDYFTGLLMISATETNKPFIGVSIQQITKQRDYDHLNGWVTKHIEKKVFAKCTVSDLENSNLEVSGADFTPESFSDGKLAAFVNIIGIELREAIDKLPVFTESVDMVKYRLAVLKALGGNKMDDGVTLRNAPWSLVGWDQDCKLEEMYARFQYLPPSVIEITT